MKLAITPIRKMNEAAIGYLLRLAVANGYQYLHRLVDKRQVNKVLRGQPTHHHFIDSLLPSQAPDLSPTSNPLFKTTRQLQAKICLSCIKHEGYIAEEIQNPHITHCSQHQQALIDYCTQCHHSLVWDISLLQGHCTHCHAELAANRNLNLEVMTQTQVADCLVAAHFIKNPQTTLINPNQFAVDSHYQMQIIQGFELLSNSQMMQDWSQQSVQRSAYAMPTNMSQISIRLLMSLLQHQWPSLEKIGLDGSTPKYSASVDIKPLKVQLTLALELLGANREQLNQLIELQLVEKQGNARLSRHSIIDLAPLLRELNTYSCIPNMQAITHHQQMLLHNDTTLTDILIGAKNGQLSIGYCANKNLASSIYCEPQQLQAFALNHFKNKHQHIISMDKAVHITGCSLKTLQLLRKAGRLRQPKWFRSGLDNYCLRDDVVSIRKLVETGQLDFDF